MAPSDSVDSRRPGFFRRHRLGCGVALYLAAALTDTALTLPGVGADLDLEGNPWIRWMMQQLGAGLGLATQKAAIGGGAIAIAVVGERAIQRNAPWIWKVPMTAWVRRWMRRKNRSWIAFIPLYAATLGQGVAVASWAVLPLLLQP